MIYIYSKPTCSFSMEDFRHVRQVGSSRVTRGPQWDPMGLRGPSAAFCVEVHSGESFGELAILGFVKRRSAVVRAKAPWRAGNIAGAPCLGEEMKTFGHGSPSINQYISQFLQHGKQYHYQIYQPTIITSITISQYSPVSVLAAY